MSKRQETENFKRWSYEEIAERPGVNLDIWADVKDESLTDAASLDAPDVIAAEIIEEVEAGLALFAQVAAELDGAGGDIDAEPDDGVEALLHEAAD